MPVENINNDSESWDGISSISESQNITSGQVFTNTVIYQDSDSGTSYILGSDELCCDSSNDYSISLDRSYPGLHPSLRHAYDLLISNLSNNSTSYDIARNVRHALDDNIERMQEDDSIREDMLSYFNYLIEHLTECKESAGSDKLNEEINKPLLESDLITPIGFEYTYHGPQDIKFLKKITCKNKPDINHLIDILKIRLRHHLKHKKSRIYNDAGLIEICSPVHKTKKELFNWYNEINSVCSEFQMKPHIKNKGGGGLHINVSYNKELEKWRETYINLFIMFANYPEINWILNEPSDNKTANSLQRNHGFIDAVIELQKKDFDIDQVWKYFLRSGGKSYAISCKTEYHFEIRTFEMIRDKSELNDYVDFINQLLIFCNNAAKEGIMIPLLEHPISIMNNNIIYHEKEDTAVKDFNRLLTVIGLDPKRYKKYVLRNFYVRRKHYGKTYLT